MNFEKNLPLHLIGIGQECYKRQLWINSLRTHVNVNNSSNMCLYAKHFAPEGPNEVISYLDHYISTLDNSISKLILFMDNCFSQNKNLYIFAYLQGIVNKSPFLTIVVYI